MDRWSLRDRECQQRVAFILVVSIAPLASNLSLALNSVATYQLFKLLQTPLVACAEAVSGFRALSLTRGALMVGVSAGVAFAELGGWASRGGEDDEGCRHLLGSGSRRGHVNVQAYRGDGGAQRHQAFTMAGCFCRVGRSVILPTSFRRQWPLARPRPGPMR